jgi:Transglycosylase SLT domain
MKPGYRGDSPTAGGVFMTNGQAAPLGATAWDSRAYSNAEVRWLKRRGAKGLRSHRRVTPRRAKRSFRRLTTVLGVGVLLSVSTAERAIGPAYAAREATPQQGGARTGDALLLAARGEPVAAVEVAAFAEAPAVGSFDLRVTPPAPLDLELFTGSTPEAEAEAVASVAPEKATLAAAPAPLPAVELPTIEARANEILRFGNVRIARPLVETVLRAAEATGVDPAYMMALADKESSFIPDIKAPTSSAQGLFQFIERTWLEVVRDFGPRHGMDVAARLIETVNGQPAIQNELLRDWVLGLRRDPYLSAVMAAEMLKRDKAKIERRIGRELERSELYLMHFLGAESAGKLLQLIEAKPKQSAPKVFPAAARANRTLFFAQERRKKVRQLSVAEVYDKLDRMIDTRLDRYDGVTAFLPSQASFALQ